MLSNLFLSSTVFHLPRLHRRESHSSPIFVAKSDADVGSKLQDKILDSQQQIPKTVLLVSSKDNNDESRNTRDAMCNSDSTSKDDRSKLSASEDDKSSTHTSKDDNLSSK
jgi:hypothetical protein